jgi:transcription elongation GreA/GreB family factor
MQRQAVLERLGWRFVRIRGSVFFRDPERAMQPVFEALERLKIEPLLAMEVENGNAQIDLIADVRRRAQQLSSQWEEEDGEEDDLPVIAPRQKEAVEPVSELLSQKAAIVNGTASEGIGKGLERSFGVQVGDSVKFVYLDTPTVVEFVMITTEPSNRMLGTINENSPLARGLLGRLEGEKVEPAEIGGRTLRIAEIYKPRRRA